MDDACDSRSAWPLAWRDILQAVSDFVERCDPGELALNDATKLEGLAIAIVIRIEDAK